MLCANVLTYLLTDKHIHTIVVSLSDQIQSKGDYIMQCTLSVRPSVRLSVSPSVDRA